MHIPHPRDIRNARLEIGYTIMDAAKIACVTESDWENWEQPTWSALYREPYGKAWQLFLKGTAKLRPVGSKFRQDLMTSK